MCIRDSFYSVSISGYHIAEAGANPISQLAFTLANGFTFVAVSYTHLRAHETVLDLVCRLLLEKKKKKINITDCIQNLAIRIIRSTHRQPISDLKLSHNTTNPHYI